jgi:phosphoribosylformimino-5-aminoimidazole carboxamide ribonucleotide (ProFAR) isomerase
MLIPMIVIPGFDLIDGNGVRLTEGVFETKKIYDDEVKVSGWPRPVLP